MANLIFKRGLFTGLKNVALQDGAVYFTTDTNELFFDAAGSRHRIGDVFIRKNLTEVTTEFGTTKEALAPIQGRLVYLTDENILCTWTGTAWTQINAQKTLAQLASVDFAVNTAGNGIDLTLADGVSGGFEFDGAGVAITKSASNVLKLSVDQVTETTETTVAGSKNNITITSKTVQNGTDKTGAAVEDAEVEGSEQVVTVKNTSNLVDVAVGTGNVINITGEIDHSLTVGTDGKLTFATTKDGVAVGAGAAVSQYITYGNNKEAALTRVNSSEGKFVLDVYDKTQTDARIDAKIVDKMRAIDSMTFKGTVGLTADSGATLVGGLPSTQYSVKIGDTYKVAQAGNYAGMTAKAGDLFIAYQKPGSAGETDVSGGEYYLTTDSIAWAQIDSGEAVTYTLRSDATQKTISLGSADMKDIGGQIIIGDSGALTFEAEGTSGAIIDHAEYTAAKTNGTAVAQKANATTTFNVITGVTSNATGHVTGVETTQVTMQPTVPTSSTTEVSVTGSTATLVQNTTYTGQADAFQSSGVKVSSESLTLTKHGSDELGLDLTWGSW